MSTNIQNLFIILLVLFTLSSAIKIVKPTLNEKQSEISSSTSAAHLDVVGAIQRLNDLTSDRDFYLKWSEYFTSLRSSMLRESIVSSSNLSESCSNQLMNLARALGAKEYWAYKIIDSFGKPSSGILQGSFNWVGEYGECINTTDASTYWKSKYCKISKLNREKLIDPNNPKMGLSFGICMPVNCTNYDIVDLLNTFAKSNVSYSDFQLDDVYCIEEKNFDARAIVAIVILSLIVAVVVSASIYDLIQIHRHKMRMDYESRNLLIQIDDDTITVNTSAQSLVEHADNQDPNASQPASTTAATAATTTWSLSALASNSNGSSIWREFSIYRNTVRIFGSSNAKNSQSVPVDKYNIESLHAIRFLSMAWIILGHTFGFAFLFSDNALFTVEWLKSFSFSIISNGFFAVDSFFLLSGLLTCYVFMRELDKPNAKITCFTLIKYYVHRYWRLTPVYMLVLMFSATLTEYLGAGPFFPKDGFEVNKCSDTWWTNLLYINNFINPNRTCFPIGWYLANDFQFHLVAPLILVPFGAGRFFLAIIVCVLFLIGNILSISLTLNSRPGSEQGMFGPESLFFSKWIYFKPWTRIAPYIIGLMLGYLLFIHKKQTYNNPSRSYILKTIGWLVSLSFTSLAIYGLYPDFKNFPVMELSRTSHILYQTFSRLIWSLGLAYIIYACESSRKNMIARVLKQKFWQPLSKLTYSAYLIHVLVIIYFYTTLEHPIHLQMQTLIYYFIANLAISYSLAYFVSVLFEMPFLSMEKLLFKKKQN